MANKTLKVLCLHGMSGFEPVATGLKNNPWFDAWVAVIQAELWKVDPNVTIDPSFVPYDDLFVKNPSGGQVLGALASLGGSWIHHAAADLFGLERGLFDIHGIHWTAGLLTQWVKNEKIRVACRQRVYDAIQEHQPDVVIAHSMGTLIVYDALSEKTQGPAAIQDRTLITFGCQIAHPSLLDQFGGRITPLKTARFWFHLYNSEDVVFTAPIRMTAPNFTQVNVKGVPPGLPNAATNHSMPLYLEDPSTRQTVWPDLATINSGQQALVRSFEAPAVALSKTTPVRRALLIGINDYPDPANRLEGCVNDTFEMSAVLQECGFAPEDIRLCLNDRATAQGIRDRLEWLLDGAADGDQRILFYSGHGAQLPTYSPDGTVNHVRETLVPFDFDWTEDHAFTDAQFLELYGQLPYGCTFAAIFDCCHAGGMTRDGSNKVRGIDPPDDIRHRMLEWDPETQMWSKRKMTPINKKVRTKESEVKAMFGNDMATLRLGIGGQVRTLAKTDYDKVKEAKDHSGPFMPVLFYACGEGQLASEYRNGATSYGAFTFALRTQFRKARAETGQASFQELLISTTKALKSLGYTQDPECHGPKSILTAPIPFVHAGTKPPAKSPKTRKPRTGPPAV